MDNSTLWTSIWTSAVWIPIIITIIIWSIIWKGLALWKAARQKDTGWFILFLIINTLGILEILYLYVFSEKDKVIPPGNEKTNADKTLINK